MAEPEEKPAAGHPVHWLIYVVVAAAVLSLIARFVFVVGVFLHYADLPPAEVDASKEGVEWSFGKLLEFLKERNVSLAVVTTTERAPGGPVIFACRSDDPLAPADRRVKIQWCRSAPEAHAFADAEGGEAFAWGRFFFQGNEDLLKSIQKALR